MQKMRTREHSIFLVFSQLLRVRERELEAEQELEREPEWFIKKEKSDKKIFLRLKVSPDHKKYGGQTISPVKLNAKSVTFKDKKKNVRISAKG